MRNDKGYLLDLIAKRYPGTRPSDLYGRKSEDNPNGLDEYQAFELDAALARRYSAIEEENWARRIHDITEAVRLTGRYHGQKHLKYKKFKGGIADTKDEEPDDENDGNLIVVGRGTVIE